mgnify:CR=1 FL=1
MERNGRFTFGWCISYRPLSDLTLANVEALAGSGETTIECCLALWGTCKGDIKAPYVCASR